MLVRSTQTHRTLSVQTFGVVLPSLVIESVSDPDHPNQLRLHTWDGRKATTAHTTTYRGCTYTSAPIPEGFSRAVRFAVASKPFESTPELVASMRKFVCGYAQLAQDEAALVIAFALASYFVDCLPVAPVLHLLGPDSESSLVLRLLGCLCRRPILVGDIDMAALSTLPAELYATLLINQSKLPQRVMRILQASSNRRFCIARGKGRINAYGAKAFAADPELPDGVGVHVSFSPAQDPPPTLTDADEEKFSIDFQARLLRYRFVNYWRVHDAQIDSLNFVPAMRDEVRTWLAPICDCGDLQQSVFSSLLQQSQEAEGARFSDDRCVVAEAALFFCHKPDTEHFFIRDLAGAVNALLEGRHEDRNLTDKMVGLLLRALGIHAHRVVKGYRVSLTDDVREQIHHIAKAYKVLSMQDGIARCPQCPSEANGQKAISNI